MSKLLFTPKCIAHPHRSRRMTRCRLPAAPMARTSLSKREEPWPTQGGMQTVTAEMPSSSLPFPRPSPKLPRPLCAYTLPPPVPGESESLALSRSDGRHWLPCSRPAPRAPRGGTRPPCHRCPHVTLLTLQQTTRTAEDAPEARSEVEHTQEERVSRTLSGGESINGFCRQWKRAVFSLQF